MTYKIQSHDIAEIIEQNYYTKELRLGKFGIYNIKKNQISEDIVFFDTSLNLINKNLVIESDKNPFEGVCINFSLHGESHFENKDINFTSKKDYSTIAYVDETIGKVFYNNSDFRSLGIFVKNEFLEENLLKHLDFDLKPNTLFKNEPTSNLCKACLGDILNTPFDGPLNSLFMQGKILEVLFHEFSYILNSQKLKPKRENKVLFSEKDMEALKKAKKILTNNFANPPTIKELSKIVALNEFKLKVGFKSVFKTTPYSIVKNERMKISKSLLQTCDYNINEISKIIGFKNQSHFSKAFYDFYGFLPKDLMKNRTYYY